MPRVARLLPVLGLLGLVACSQASPTKEYTLKGQILDLKPERREVLVKHEDIPGFMPAMTMPYTVGDAALLEGKQPGDLITATLVVGETEAHLSAITRTGNAPIVQAAAPDITVGTMLRVGEALPTTPLVDQTGATTSIDRLKGHRVVLTFIYTRCPDPEFCPLMDRNFVALQTAIRETPGLADVRLLSISFDPEHDTPAVLRAHAQSLKADPTLWTFTAPAPADLKAFTAKFGVTAEPGAATQGAILHNLSTAVVGADGTLVKIHPGNRWTPSEILADLSAVPAATH